MVHREVCFVKEGFCDEALVEEWRLDLWTGGQLEVVSDVGA